MLAFCESKWHNTNLKIKEYLYWLFSESNHLYPLNSWLKPPLVHTAFRNVISSSSQIEPEDSPHNGWGYVSVLLPRLLCLQSERTRSYSGFVCELIPLPVCSMEGLIPGNGSALRVICSAPLPLSPSSFYPVSYIL